MAEANDSTKKGMNSGGGLMGNMSLPPLGSIGGNIA
jgi:hypothetical protein